MREELIEKLKVVTQEEKKILESGRVDKDIYTHTFSPKEFTVDSRKMLEAGELITVRTHTRFVYFPEHRHNYVEVLYVCRGAVTNMINKKAVVVRQGELLFLNQHTYHEILPAREEDIAINFIVLPQFFDVALEMTGSNNVLADFFVNVLRRDEEIGEYLHFKVAEVVQIQNLLENIIYSLVNETGNQAVMNQVTMGLVFLYLLESAQYMEMRVPNEYDNMIIMTTLEYIELHYNRASLGELCEKLHLPMYVLSRTIKKGTGFTFKQLLQRKRLNKAVSLLCETDLPVGDMIASVGYENASYFHRVFKERYHMTPNSFREKNRKEHFIRI